MTEFFIVSLMVYEPFVDYSYLIYKWLGMSGAGHAWCAASLIPLVKSMACSV
jgi:hypothetical protein